MDNFELRYELPTHTDPEKGRYDALIKRHEGMITGIAEKLLQNDNENISDYPKLGEGAIGKVFSVGKKDKCCIKIIKRPTQSGVHDLNYSVDKEFSFQKKFEGLHTSGVRVPKTYALYSNEQTGLSFFFMEKVKGFSLKDIIEGHMDFPSNFNLCNFFDALEKFVAEMNNTGHAHHRDLHSGNIMVDNNGNPWIIDFGSTTNIDAYLSHDEEEAGILNDVDVSRLRRVRTEVVTYLQK